MRAIDTKKEMKKEKRFLHGLLWKITLPLERIFWDIQQQKNSSIIFSVKWDCVECCNDSSIVLCSVKLSTCAIYKQHGLFGQETI